MKSFIVASSVYFEDKGTIKSTQNKEKPLFTHFFALPLQNIYLEEDIFTHNKHNYGASKTFRF